MSKRPRYHPCIVGRRADGDTNTTALRACCPFYLKIRHEKIAVVQQQKKQNDDGEAAAQKLCQLHGWARGAASFGPCHRLMCRCAGSLRI
ncbi:unnamed protein product [Ectocarpus sp. CCAP 1310/34]|nr:unnamed protein product [Ectocarpus sp. CCAP 1310/34]